MDDDFVEKLTKVGAWGLLLALFIWLFKPVSREHNRK